MAEDDPKDSTASDSEEESAANGGNGVEAEAKPPPDPLSQCQEEAKRLKEQLLRTAADFDNFRKRARREQTDAEKSAREDFLRELLPVFDNLERAAAHAETATDVQSLTDGIRMVMRQFADTLERVGVKRVPTVGTPFDPAVHEAIQQLETTEHPPGTVAAEIQAGYRNPERLIRPALVVVAKAPAGAEAASDDKS